MSKILESLKIRKNPKPERVNGIYQPISAKKFPSCGGNQRWGAAALGYHGGTPPQEALSGLLWAIPLPTAASPAASHPFPAVLCGTQQIWHFLCLTLPAGTSSEWSKHCALVCSAQASQGTAPVLASFRDAALCQAGSTKTLQQIWLGECLKLPSFWESL